MIIFWIIVAFVIALALFQVLAMTIGCGSFALLSYVGQRHDRTLETEEVIRRLADMGSPGDATI